MLNRRTFLRGSLAASAGALLPRRTFAITGPTKITHVSVQIATGKRLTPVAPNAYKGYRGYDVNEPVLRIRTADGLEGIGRQGAKPDVLKRLIGLDPFKLFDWSGDIIRGPAEEHKTVLDELAGCDVALLDLIGKSMGKPVADLLGPREREAVDVYDSSLYMEDLLKPNEREHLAYIGDAKPPDDPAEWVARKAQWVLAQPGGVRILKIKLGRVKWMRDMRAATDRDISVIKAVRRAVGKDVRLLVDGNDGYKPDPVAETVRFALATKDDDVYMMEQMFPQRMIAETREEKERIRAAGLRTRIADGENDAYGIPEKNCAERFNTDPLFDINQPDMNQNGYLRMLWIARRSANHGITMSPNNFCSKIGFCSMVHLGLVVSNWEFCEGDDSQFAGLRAEGIVVENGKAKLTRRGGGVGVVFDETKLEKPSVLIQA
jgi:L-alanine-DL-glutamate epimerase-like enolase superfamily enzyme